MSYILSQQHKIFHHFHNWMNQYVLRHVLITQNPSPFHNGKKDLLSHKWSHYRTLTCLMLCSYLFQQKRASFFQLWVDSLLLSGNAQHTLLNFQCKHLIKWMLLSRRRRRVMDNFHLFIRNLSVNLFHFLKTN